MKHYQIADRLHLQRAQLGNGESIVAVLTGEKRAPRKGEWYLSGAIPEAWRAPNDLSTTYHICKLYKAVTRTVVTVALGDEVQG